MTTRRTALVTAIIGLLAVAVLSLRPSIVASPSATHRPATPAPSSGELSPEVPNASAAAAPTGPPATPGATQASPAARTPGAVSSPGDQPPVTIQTSGAVCGAATASIHVDVTAQPGAPLLRSVQVFLAGSAAALHPAPSPPADHYAGTASAARTTRNSSWNIQVFDTAGREFGLSTPDNC